MGWRHTSSGATTQLGVLSLKLPEFMTARISDSFLVKSQDPRRLPSCGSHSRPSEPPADPQVSFSGPGRTGEASEEDPELLHKPRHQRPSHCWSQGQTRSAVGARKRGSISPRIHADQAPSSITSAGSEEGLPPGAPVWPSGGFRQSSESGSHGIQAPGAAFAP